MTAPRMGRAEMIEISNFFPTRHQAGLASPAFAGAPLICAGRGFVGAIRRTRLGR